jgi:hypothetical protein
MNRDCPTALTAPKEESQVRTAEVRSSALDGDLLGQERQHYESPLSGLETPLRGLGGKS